MTEAGALLNVITFVIGNKNDKPLEREDSDEYAQQEHLHFFLPLLPFLTQLLTVLPPFFLVPRFS